MSRTLAFVLDADELALRHHIRDWEGKAGTPGYDIRLTDGILHAGHETMRQLGLDHNDTTPRELYYALIDRARQDSNTLAAHLGIEPSDSPAVMIHKLLSWLKTCDIPRELWVIKASGLRALLKKQPPKQLMKALGLRSIDSVLKRNDPSEILALATLVEKPEWVKKFKAQYKKLAPKDFQTQKAEIHVVKHDQTVKLREKGLVSTRLVNPCYETGVLVLLTPEKRFSADVLTIATTIIESISDMRRHSAYFRMLSPKADFGQQLVGVCTYGLRHVSQAQSVLHWNPVHRHLVGNQEYTESLSQPHFGHEDLPTGKSSDVLTVLDPRYAFWQGKEHVIHSAKNEGRVSLHIADAAINASNQSHFENATVVYGQNRLWDELWMPYLEHEDLRQEIIRSFFEE